METANSGSIQASQPPAASHGLCGHSEERGRDTLFSNHRERAFGNMEKDLKKDGSPGVKAIKLAIWTYRLFISPLFPPSCRFTPSCSQYALEAVEVHGALKGSWLAIRRILRCHPFNPGGFDPVPPKHS
jgi:putative membrane protein insertion efficiency factor